MTIPAVVVGASGYVGGELLRLLAEHPGFHVHAALSGSQNGKAISDVFTHLSAHFPNTQFTSGEAWLDALDRGSDLAVFCAAPHGGAAATLSSLLELTAALDLNVHIVDASADFRHASAAQFQSIYGSAHGAPALLDQFTCAVPEHVAEVSTPHVGHPGCFATAMLLGLVPLASHGLISDTVYVSAITGSTGSGQSPSAGTHHPQRHSNLYAYKPLAHRHVPEVEQGIAVASGRSTTVRFVPHSGPFARGIHATIQSPLAKAADSDTVLAALSEFYAAHDFVRVSATPPKLKDVTGSNYAVISATVVDDSLVAMVAIDNLIKGAAGGCVQWMNRLFDLAPTTGLTAAPIALG